MNRRRLLQRLGLGGALAAIATALGVRKAEASCWTQYSFTPISPCRSQKYHRTCCDYSCGQGGSQCCYSWFYDGIVNVNNCAYYGYASCCCTTCP